MKMIFPFFLLIFFIWSANAATPENHHKINLEDIEHDNLINERRLQGKEPLEGQQTQHLRPPGIQYHSEYEAAAASPLQGGIVYVDAETQNEIEPEEENELTPQQSGGGHHPTAQVVQYVTPEAPTQAYHQQQQYYSPHKVYGPPSAPATAAVHESSHTYAAPSRQTLIKPILPTVATFLQPHQQPQFVYVQTGQQQSRPQAQTSEHVPRAQSYQYVSQHHLQQQEGITYAHEGQNIAQQNTREEEQDYQQQAPRNPNYMQYVPYVARGSSGSQAYIIMSAIPAGYKQSIEPSNVGPSTATTYAKPVGQAAVRVIPYQPTQIPPSGPGVELHLPSENHGDNSDRDEGPTAPEAQQDIQYAAPNQYRPSSENSKQKLYAPKHPEKQEPEVHRQLQLPPHHVAAQQSIQVVPLQSQPVYVAPQVIHQQVQHPVGFGPSFDFFHGRQSKSLLDSYIPSWVIIQRSRAVDPSQQYAQSFTPITTASSYNTIAYSVPQHAVQYSGGHFKQSTKVKA